MSDAPTFDALLREYQLEAGKIVAAGGMATKSRVEDILMARHGIDRATAHDVANTCEYKGLLPIAPTREAYYGINFKWAYGIYGNEKPDYICASCSARHGCGERCEAWKREHGGEK